MSGANRDLLSFQKFPFWYYHVLASCISFPARGPRRSRNTTSSPKRKVVRDKIKRKCEADELKNTQERFRQKPSRSMQGPCVGLLHALVSNQRQSSDCVDFCAITAASGTFGIQQGPTSGLAPRPRKRATENHGNAYRPLPRG